MNEKLEKLINEEISKQKTKEQEKRDNHLISLGLTDNNKQIKTYYTYWREDLKQDEKGYYAISEGPIDISDGEYIQLCKYFPTDKKFNNLGSIDTADSGDPISNTNDYLAIITFFLGVVGFIQGIISTDILWGFTALFSSIILGVFFLSVSKIILLLNKILNKK